MAIERIGLAGYFKNKLAVKTAKKCLSLAEKYGFSVSIASDFPISLQSGSAKNIGANLVDLPDLDADLVFVFGGDGSLLHSFRALGKKQLPLMGINCGEIGYLMDLDSHDFEKKLPLILQENFIIEKRLRLQGIVDGAKLPLALNEFTITPILSATIMRYSLKVDNNFLWKDSADGIIASTPTGSTAYSLSTGGPIVFSDTGVLLVNPINSMNNTKHLVLNESSEINVFNIGAFSGCEVVVDGQERFKVKDEVAIKKSDSPALLARLSNSKFSYFGKKSYLSQNISTAEELKDAPPSAKFILKVLELEKSLTQKEIINITQLPNRTVRRALEYLAKKDIITKRPFISDPRQDIYILSKKTGD